MVEYGIFQVAVAPPAVVSSDLIEQTMSILKGDRYGTRLLLSAKIPKIVAHYQTAQAAESVVQKLDSGHCSIYGRRFGTS